MGHVSLGVMVMENGSMFANAGGGGLTQVIAVSLLVGAFAVVVEARYGGGMGTADHPYLIFTAEQLNAIGSQPDDWGEHFKLMADIDLSGYGSTGFHSIGTGDEGPFTGVFDGNHKAISNLSASCDYEGYLGLFGLLGGAETRIMNVTLVAATITGGSGRYVAALVGFLREGTITNCHVRAGSISGGNFIGGLVGKSQDGTIVDCTVSATVCGVARVGGLIGQNYYGAVERCRVVGAVQGSSWAVGGLIGENSNSTVTACHARCAVTGDSYIGGLVGDNLLARVDCGWAGGVITGGATVGGLVGRSNGGAFADCYARADVTGGTVVGGLVGLHGPSCYCEEFEHGLVVRCYAAGPVRGAEDTGGLIGRNDRENHVEQSFWDIEAAGCEVSAGGVAKTTAQMCNPATYLDAGWDFVGEQKNGTQDIWRMHVPQGYPWLTWEPIPGDLTADGRVDLWDFSRFAGQWRLIDTGFWSGGLCMTIDGIVDIDDLANLANTWLAHLK
jgi:hypothetical protein